MLFRFSISSVQLAQGSVLHHGTVDQLSSLLRSIGLQQQKRQETSVEHQQQQQQDRIQTQEPPLLLLPNKEGIEGKRDRCTLQQLFHLHKTVDEESLAGFDFYDYPNSRFQEVAILTHRFLKNVFRTRELFACRTIQSSVRYSSTSKKIRS